MTVATRTRRVDGERLVSRVVALRRFIEIVDGTVPDGPARAARTVLERSGQRLSLSGDHTWWRSPARPGAGKSRPVQQDRGPAALARSGLRRPTTGIAHSCTWGPDASTKPPARLARRAERPPVHQGERARRRRRGGPARPGAARPCPTSTPSEEEHRVEVDRLLDLVDLMVWVLDPQKYADKVVHERYLRQFPTTATSRSCCSTSPTGWP
jgi:hypothetical protein